MIHWSVPKAYFLGVLLLFLPIPLASIEVSLDVVINNGSTQTLRANLGDDLAFAASAFLRRTIFTTELVAQRMLNASQSSCSKLLSVKL